MKPSKSRGGSVRVLFSEPSGPIMPHRILSKVMSRPGPYDVLVEFPEFVSSRNLMALKRNIRALPIPGGEATTYSTSVNGAAGGIDLRESEVVARLMLRAHLSAPTGAGAKVRTYTSSGHAESSNGGT